MAEEDWFADGAGVVHLGRGPQKPRGVESGGVIRVFFGTIGEQKKLLIDYAPVTKA